jgi:hypothetical protein
MRRIRPLLLAAAAAFALTAAPAHALQPIEPLGGQLRLTQQGVDGTQDEDAAAPDIAYNSQRNEYLAVWENRFASGDKEIFGRRLAADGTPIGGAFQISGLPTDEAGNESRSPAVAYDFERDRYAVVYTRKFFSSRQVFIQLVSANGSLLKSDGTAGAGAVLMSSVGADATRGVLDGLALTYRPDASGDSVPGDRWVAAYSGDELADDDFDIMVSAMNAATGLFVGFDKIVNDASGVNEFSPTLAPIPNSDEIAVAWQGSLNVSDVEVFARRVSPALTTSGAQQKITATGGPVNFASAPRIAADPEHGQLLVAYQANKTDADGTEIHVQRLNPDLGQIGIDDQQLSSAGPPGSGSAFSANLPAAAYLPNLDRFLVTWIGNDTGRPGLSDDEREVMGTALDANGVEDAPEDFTISRMGVDNDEDAAPFGAANVAANTQTGRWLSVWSSDDGRPPLADNEFELFGRAVGENFDRDGDGVAVPQDCDDGNAAIHPGANDAFDDGIDQDCSGTDAQNPDRDADGAARPADCDDANPFIKPGAADVPGNGVDEDCSGADAQLPPKPLEVTRATIARFFSVFREFTKVTRLQVNNTRPGMRIELRCSGGGCPKALRGKVRKVNVRSAGSVKFTKLLKKARLRPKAVVEVRALETGAIGRVDRFVMKDRKNPAQVSRCLLPGAKKPSPCPR